MPLINVVAEFGCDFCGRQFVVSIDPAPDVPDGWSTFDVAVDAVRGAVGYRSDDAGLSSVVGEFEVLCATCTRVNDQKGLEDGGEV